jgi:hypothetical protein
VREMNTERDRERNRKRMGDGEETKNPPARKGYVGNACEHASTHGAGRRC